MVECTYTCNLCSEHFLPDDINLIGIEWTTRTIFFIIAKCDATKDHICKACLCNAAELFKLIQHPSTHP